MKPLPSDPWLFATQCALTFDEESSVKGTDAIRRFPDYDYLRLIVREIDANPFTWIAKSGQLTVSWCLQVYFLHQVLTKRAYRLAYYCLTQTKAEGHVESRFWRLYQHIPPEHGKPHAEFKNGRMYVYHDGPGTLPTSFIIPQAAEQGKQEDAAAKMRSETWTAALLDESAFYPNLGELHNSLVPRTQRMVHVSTPNGSNVFARVGLGSMDDPRQQIIDYKAAQGLEKLQTGVHRWMRNGFRCLRVHYSAHPDRDPDTAKGQEWYRQKRAVSGKLEWDREQEVSFETAAGWPVYETEPVFDDAGVQTGGLIVRDQVIIEGRYIERGWDFGYLWPFVVFAQVQPVLDEQGREIGERLCVLAETTLNNSTTEELAEHVKRMSVNVFGKHAMFRDYCDFYGGNQRTSRNPKTDVEILQAAGISALSTPQPIRLGVETGQKLITAGLMEVDPSCNYLLTALRSGYRRDDNGEIPTENKKPHPHGDVCFVPGTMILMADGTEKPIETVEIGDMVQTRYGPKTVTATMKRPADTTVTMLAGGRKITATPNHRFMTDSGQWMTIDALRYSVYTVYVCSPPLNPSFGTDGNTPAGSPANGVTSNTTAAPFGSAEPPCTVTFGSLFTDLFRRGTTFITRTETRSTTTSAIWSALRRWTTPSCTGQTSNVESGRGDSLSRSGHWRQLGTRARRAVSFIAGLASVYGRAGRNARFDAASAAESTKAIAPGSAATPARRDTVSAAARTTSSVSVLCVDRRSPSIGTAQPRLVGVSAERFCDAGPSMVHNITVEGVHEYIANGFVVANCDAFRYVVSHVFHFRQQHGDGRRSYHPPALVTASTLEGRRVRGAGGRVSNVPKIVNTPHQAPGTARHDPNPEQHGRHSYRPRQWSRF